ncbi:class I SAM-dependent methyltransferase [Micromonospora aurantiaca]|uniref:class I SAM-dependent methyltransferase n=1 Tax=Micromonospora aurantiaca (nom. illeg.) TaxID=47850 RepID=UPI002E196DF9
MTGTPDPAAPATATPAACAPAWPGDWATDGLWRLIWFGPAHQGWEFGSYAGPALLDRAVEELPLHASDRVLHLGSDGGETSRYLALGAGCAVTAVEPDPVRRGHARRRARALPPDVAARVRIAGSTSEGTSGPPFDRVLVLQPARTGDDLAAVLRQAALAARPGGRILLGELVHHRPGRPRGAAPNGLEVRLRQAGFAGPRSVDITDEAVDALRTAQLTLIRRRHEVLRHLPPAAADQFLALILTAQADLREGRSRFWAVNATRTSPVPGRV